MDQNLRDLCRACGYGDDASCLQAFIGYRRAGVPSREMPREVLYGKTRHQLLNQDALDFRSLLVRFGILYRAIRFNDGVDISIQGHRGAYCRPREDRSDPRDYTQLEFLFDAPIKQTELYLPSHLVAEIAQGLATPSVGLTPEQLRDVKTLREAMANPLCRIKQEQIGVGPLANTEITIRHANPDFLEGEVYYGLPHLDVFSPYGQESPYVPIAKVQCVFDFLRARFGLVGEI